MSHYYTSLCKYATMAMMTAVRICSLNVCNCAALGLDWQVVRCFYWCALDCQSDIQSQYHPDVLSKHVAMSITTTLSASILVKCI